VDREKLAGRLREILGTATGRTTRGSSGGVVSGDVCALPGARTAGSVGGLSDERPGVWEEVPAGEAAAAGCDLLPGGGGVRKPAIRAGAGWAGQLGLTEYHSAHGRCQVVERRHEGFERHGRGTIDANAPRFVPHPGALGLVSPEH
jgi:hypothetical protein